MVCLCLNKKGKGPGNGLPLLKQKSSAHIERKQAEKERALRLDKLTGELKEKQVVREGSWEFREGESQTERRIR